MINPKLVEGALGMLARVIPQEEYAKANAAIAQIIELFETIDARAKRTEEAAVHAANKLDELYARLTMMEAALGADSPTYSAMQSEYAGWMIAGKIETALAPAKEGSLNE